MSSSKHGSSSGGQGGDDPFHNSTPSSMSKKLKDPKKKKGKPESREAQQQQSQRRREQNRSSQRAYRERREQRLRELEYLIQQEELLNQTLTAAYNELRAEMDRLAAEKAQEQYLASLSAGQGEPGPSMDPSQAASGSVVAGYGQGNVTWGDDAWIATQNWQPEGDYGERQL